MVPIAAFMVTKRNIYGKFDDLGPIYLMVISKQIFKLLNMDENWPDWSNFRHIILTWYKQPHKTKKLEKN
jgi:hypothetical protein